MTAVHTTIRSHVWIICNS